MNRLALALLLAAALAPALLRRTAERPAAHAPCRGEGRGTPPRGWLGCAADPGPARPLSDEERLVLGLPLDPNTASERGLAWIPGLSRRLAAAVVRDRAAGGPFGSIDDVARVRGVGPKRLAQARPALCVGAAP